MCNGLAGQSASIASGRTGGSQENAKGTNVWADPVLAFGWLCDLDVLSTTLGCSLLLCTNGKANLSVVRDLLKSLKEAELVRVPEKRGCLWVSLP